eukprot:533161_1
MHHGYSLWCMDIKVDSPFNLMPNTFYSKSCVNPKIDPQFNFKSNIKSNPIPFSLRRYACAMILSCMKAYIGKNVQNAVITVPAFFNEAQHRATQDAGQTNY